MSTAQIDKPPARALPPRSAEVSRLTLGDLFEQLGPIPLRRVVWEPLPGTATVDHVLDHQRRTDRVCELLCGTLLEKDVGFRESLLAARLITLLNIYLLRQPLGVVSGEQGGLRLFADQVRIPDVAFISWDRLPGRRVPTEPVPQLAPDLAVEVLSAGNTQREMSAKLTDYLRAGVRLVWYLDPGTRTVEVFTGQAAEQRRVLSVGDTLDGGAVLPGFAVPLAELFAEPTPAGDPGATAS